MDAPIEHGYHLTDKQRSAIAASVLAGKPQTQVAQEFAVHRNTVSRIVSEVTQAVPQIAGMLAGDWRTAQTQRAVASVDRALIDESDVYKSATIGVQVLKGLGVYAADQQTNVSVMLGSLSASAEALIEAEVTGGTDPNL